MITSTKKKPKSPNQETDTKLNKKTRKTFKYSRKHRWYQNSKPNPYSNQNSNEKQNIQS